MPPMTYDLRLCVQLLNGNEINEIDQCITSVDENGDIVVTIDEVFKRFSSHKYIHVPLNSFALRAGFAYITIR